MLPGEGLDATGDCVAGADDGREGALARPNLVHGVVDVVCPTAFGLIGQEVENYGLGQGNASLR